MATVFVGQGALEPFKIFQDFAGPARDTRKGILRDPGAVWVSSLTRSARPFNARRRRQADAGLHQIRDQLRRRFIQRNPHQVPMI
jgi:hypothetical protein